MSEFNFSLLKTDPFNLNSDKFQSKLQTIFDYSDCELAKIDINDNIGTKFPVKIQELLLDDFFSITVSKVLPVLPYYPSINQIIDKYLESRKKICEMIMKIKSGKKSLFITLPSVYKNECSDYGDPDLQLIYINDIFNKIKIYIEKFYVKCLYNEEEKLYISEKTSEKSSLNVLGVKHLIRLIILISQLMVKMNLMQNEKG